MALSRPRRQRPLVRLECRDVAAGGGGALGAAVDAAVAAAGAQAAALLDRAQRPGRRRAGDKKYMKTCATDLYMCVVTIVMSTITYLL